MTPDGGHNPAACCCSVDSPLSTDTVPIDTASIARCFMEVPFR